MIRGSQELRDNLPHGAITRMAELFNCSTLWIRRVVTGKDKGDANILKCASKLTTVNKSFDKQVNKVYDQFRTNK